MRALVVYESMFGNTRLVADAVADGLASVLDVDVDIVEVVAAPSSLDGGTWWSSEARPTRSG